MLEPASALKAPAWTSAQAADCDLKSRLRNSISVWGPCLCFLLTLCLSISLSLTPSSSALVIIFIFVSISFLHLSASSSFFIFFSKNCPMFFSFYALSDQESSFSCSCHPIFMSYEPPVDEKTVQNQRVQSRDAFFEFSTFWTVLVSKFLPE